MSAALPHVPNPAPVPSTGRTVLLVEDEDGVRAFVRHALERSGYAVLPADGPVEAVRLFAANPGRVDLVLTDVLLPVKTGPELVRDLRAARPDLRVLFMSAFTGGGPHGQGPLPPGAPLLEKPFTLARLLNAVTQALA